MLIGPTIALRRLLIARSTLAAYVPFVLITLASLVITLWAWRILATFPYAGLDSTFEWLAHDGLILVVDPTGPAVAADLRPGDRITAVDGVPLTMLAPLFKGRVPGDRVFLRVRRG